MLDVRLELRLEVYLELSPATGAGGQIAATHWRMRLRHTSAPSLA